MELLIISIFILVGSSLIYLRWRIGSKRNFDHEFNRIFQKYGLTLVNSEYPGLLKVGPFKKIQIEYGKPQINGGAIQYERTYYREINAITKDNQSIKIWAKIETGWFKDMTIEFDPKLTEIK